MVAGASAVDGSCAAAVVDFAASVVAAVVDLAAAVVDFAAAVVDLAAEEDLAADDAFVSALVLLGFADFVSEAFVSEVFASEAFVSFSASVASVPFIPFFPSVGNLLFRSDVLIPDWLIEKAAWFGFPAISSTWMTFTPNAA